MRRPRLNCGRSLHPLGRVVAMRERYNQSKFRRNAADETARVFQSRCQSDRRPMQASKIEHLENPCQRALTQADAACFGYPLTSSVISLGALTFARLKRVRCWAGQVPVEA